MADQWQAEPGLVLDARGAAWFSESGVLALAGVHLGLQTLPRPGGFPFAFSALDDAIMRLSELLADYRPATTVVLGDPLSAGLSPATLEHACKSFAAAVACYGELVLVTRDPEERLARLARQWSLPWRVVASFSQGRGLWVQGDDSCLAEVQTWWAGPGQGGRVVYNLEHPEWVVTERLPRPARCRCFLLAADRLCLPAYNPDLPGHDLSAGRFQSPLSRGVSWQRVVAIAGLKLIPLPGERVPRG